MSCNCHGKCVLAKIAWILVVVGALNWGVVGVGNLLGHYMSWNLVTWLVASWSKIGAAVVYVLVGLSALVSIFGCPCKKCKDAKANCAGCKVDAAPSSTPAQTM